MTTENRRVVSGRCNGPELEKIERRGRSSLEERRWRKEKSFRDVGSTYRRAPFRGNTPEALWTIGLVFPTESTSPWTFSRRKQRERESHDPWLQGNMKATPDRAAIFHNSRGPTSLKRIVTSIVSKWPVKFVAGASSRNLSRVPFRSSLCHWATIRWYFS